MGKLKAALLVTAARKTQEKRQKAQPNIEKTLKSKLQIPYHIFSDGTRSLYPFKEDSSILVVGDGDLSFSCALVSIFGKSISLYCTVLETQETLREKYVSAAQNIDYLTNSGCCSLLFGVDGTNLKSSAALKDMRFDRIIFNFPHTGRGIKDQRRNILDNQRLVAGFFKSAKSFLKGFSNTKDLQFTSLPSYRSCLHPIKEISEQSLLEFQDYLLSKTHLSIANSKPADDDENDDDLEKFNESKKGSYCSSKSAPGEIHVTIKEGEPYDLWDIKGLATSAGLTCKESFGFFFEKYPKYLHKRSIGDILTADPDLKDHVTENKRLKTWVFVEAPPKSPSTASRK